MPQIPAPDHPGTDAPAEAGGGDARVALDVREVSVRYNGVAGLLALDRLSFRVHEGEWVSIVGPSGCGKSTLLRVVGGLLEPTAGALSVLGGAPEEAQRRKRLGLVFQQPALLPWRSAEENVRLPLDVNRGAGREGMGVPALLDLVGLRAFEAYRPHELSGGMQQRVALARALAIDPPILLMDEPFAALDEITREQMRYELLRIWVAASAQAPKTVLFVTHSVAEAVALSDRVIVMSQRPGRIKATIPIALPRPRSAADERTPASLDYVDQIRAHLREETAP